jgi:hypothetical protein
MVPASLRRGNSGKTINAAGHPTKIISLQHSLSGAALVNKTEIELRDILISDFLKKKFTHRFRSRLRLGRVQDVFNRMN